AFATLPGAFLAASDPRALTAIAACRTFDLARRGTARLEGGRDALRQMLLEKLEKQHAGEVIRGTPTEFSHKWGRVGGVYVDGDSIGCQAVLWAAPAHAIAELMDKPPKRALQTAQAMRPTAYRYVLHLVLAEAGVPQGISPITLCAMDAAAPLVGDHAFCVHVGDPDDDARVLVSVVANAPTADAATLADLRRRLLARVDDLMPFFAH